MSALGLIDQDGIGIDLLLTDVVMPGLNGRQLAEKAQERRPSLKVLFTTGYTRNAIVHQGRLDAGVEMIQKPITQEGLASRIRDLFLDAPPSSPLSSPDGLRPRRRGAALKRHWRGQRIEPAKI